MPPNWSLFICFLDNFIDTNRMASNNNPTGINQYKNCRMLFLISQFLVWLFLTLSQARADDEHVETILREYHRRGITNRSHLSELLLGEHGIQMRYVLSLFINSTQ
jgi:hypothetical protein